jgi:hypothetical protein
MSLMRRLIMLAAAAAIPTFAADCDRACLKGLLDQYLNAIVQHKPKAAPLSPGFRQTENAMVRRTGTGLWQSAKALGKLQRRYMDPEGAHAGFFGLLDEEAGPAIVSLRMKVEDRKITEAEWYVNRKGDPGIGTGAGLQAAAAFYDPEYLLAHAPPERIVPKAERVSRNDMIAIANSYFDGLAAKDGSLILAHPGCWRVENGTSTTQRDAPAGTKPGTTGVVNGKTDCTFEGPMANIFSVTSRRFPIVDQEAGAVLVVALFQRKPGLAMKRNLLSEWFFIDQAKIRSVYAAMYYPEQEALAPNWPPFDGNWPVPPPPK